MTTILKSTFANTVKTMPSRRKRRKLRRLIARKFSEDKLREYCDMSIPEVFDALHGVTYGKPGEQYAYKRNGSDVLAVVHADTVQTKTKLTRAELTDGLIFFSPVLDDRLGIYTIMELLPRLGINLDILVTENEEIGQSTAEDFAPKKTYNWLVEFDRRGTGAVLYAYEDREWTNTVSDFFDVKVGSVSDISYMESLGCKALNVVIGYYEEHALRSYFEFSEYIDQLVKFIAFCYRYKDTVFPHEEQARTPGYTYITRRHDPYLKEDPWNTDWCEVRDEQNAIGWCVECEIEVYKDELII